MRSRQKHPKFFCDPDWPNQQINRSLEKRRMVSFNSVAEKQEHPPTEKKSRSPNPFHENEKDKPGKNHRDADTMQQLVRGRFVLVVVLRHVVRQVRHQRTSCQPLDGWHASGGETATINDGLYTEMRKLTRASWNYWE